MYATVRMKQDRVDEALALMSEIEAEAPFGPVESPLPLPSRVPRGAECSEGQALESRDGAAFGMSFSVATLGFFFSDAGSERGVLVQSEPLPVDMFADELQPVLACRSGASLSASVLAACTRPHDLQQLHVFRLGPIAEARLGLALTSSTKLLCVQTMTDLRTTQITSVGARPRA